MEDKFVSDILGGVTMINEKEAIKIIDNPWEDCNKGRYILLNGDSKFGFTAIDNSTGDCWVEDFDTLAHAKSWF